MKNFYTILNIQDNADSATIKKAFRSMAMKYHPDKPQGDSEKFRQANIAYKVLSNPSSRIDYDKTLCNFKRKSGGIDDYTRNIHKVEGKNLKKLIKEIINQGHLTSIIIRYKGKKLFKLSFPIAAGITVLGIIKAPISFILLQIGLKSFFEIEVTNQVVTMYNEAMSMHESGNFLEAEHLYKKILKKSEYFIPAYMNLGMLYRQRGNNIEAINNFKKVLDMAPFGEIGEMAGRHLNELRGF
ncbi:protein containing Heat shock protein DnaJ [Candidatus Magnetomorum sp. HK-1]|nr:protein containing Heat shock protein DnaJ [Candidatus Magnetomorum sp. HK-1]